MSARYVPPAKRKPIASLNALTAQLEATRIDNGGGGASSGPPARSAPADSAASGNIRGGGSSNGVQRSSSSPSPPPSASPPPASASPPEATVPAGAAASSSSATAAASRNSPSPSPSPPPPASSRWRRSPPPTREYERNGSSSAAASASPPPVFGSAAAAAAASASAPPRKGLIIDRERQAAIDAAYGMGSSASAGGGSGTDVGCAALEQVLEAYDLPSGMTLASVQQALEVRRENNVLRVAPGVDEASALVVFSSERSARDALDKHQSQQPPQRHRQPSDEDGDAGRNNSDGSSSENGVSFKLRSMATASRETRLAASSLALPPAQRKATDSRAATRMLAGALGLRLPRQSPEAREEEKRAREERRRKLDEKRAAAAAAATTAAATIEANHADAWED